MVYPFRNQPLKGLYLTYAVLSTLFIRIPIWTILALPRSRRPRKSWSIRRSVLVRLFRHLVDVEKRTGALNFSPDYRAIKSGSGATGGWIPPVPDNLIVGKLEQWAKHAYVTSIRIPGYWILEKATDIDPVSSPRPGEKVVLAFHGGAYIRLSAHPSDPPGVIARGLVHHVENVHRVFAVEYRLSSGEPFKVAHPFPTALIDALAGYIYLVNEVGFSPSDIIVEGDSAGGNLAYALTRYLMEYKGTPGLPGPPGSLILLSPWADVSDSHTHIPDGSATTSIESDILGAPVTNLKYPVNAFIGPHGLEATATNPYISPASLDPSLEVDFKGFPRTFLVAGGAEVLLDQMRTLRDRMVKDLGEGNGVLDGEGKVRYHEPADAVLISWFFLGMSRNQERYLRLLQSGSRLHDYCRS